MTSPNRAQPTQQDINRLAEAEKAQNVVDQQTVAAAAEQNSDRAKPDPASGEAKDPSTGR